MNPYANGRLWTRVCLTLAAALLLPSLETGASAQSSDGSGSGGFRIREVSVSTGYVSVELPPATRGGVVPSAILDEDLITTGTARAEWRRVTSLTGYALELSGTYTARTRHPQLNAVGAGLTVSLSRVLGSRWRLAADLANEMTNWDQFAFRQTHARRLVENAASFEHLAGDVLLSGARRSDLSDRVPFERISHSLDGADLYGHRVLVSNVRAGATYTHSPRLEGYLSGSYTSVRQISSSGRPGQGLSSPYSTEGGPEIGVRYRTSERTELTTSLNWSHLSGAYAEKALFATATHGWSGRKWFTRGTVGAALRSLRTLESPARMANRSRAHAIIYGAGLGYRFRAQTLLLQYSQMPHDEYGHGGRNRITGFDGHVRSAVGSWSWSAPRGRWTAGADFWMVRRPGDLSYLSSWFSTVGLGRRLGPNVRLTGELLFDRHGSRQFEGFRLTRGGARFKMVWTPSRRRAVSTGPDESRE